MSGPFGSSQWMYASGAEAENQSLRFNGDDTAYLSRTPASAGNRKTWTWSGWVKRGNVDDAARRVVFGGGQTASGVDITYIEFKDGDNIRFAGYDGSSEPFSLITTQVYRDASAWYHIVAAFDTSQATSSDRVSLYINGEKVTAFSTENYPSQNYDGGVNSTQLHVLGRDPNADQLYFDGYLAEVNFVDGTALDPTSFGETDANGQWVPIIAPSLTYGTNGFYLPFLNGIGDDESGNSNDFTANSIATTDMMLDSPLNNFAVFNSISNSTILSEGNLQSTINSQTWSNTVSTFEMNSGKWYAEMVIEAHGSGNTAPAFGIAVDDAKAYPFTSGSPAWSTGDGSYVLASNKGQIKDGVETVIAGDYAVGDIIQVAYDADNGKLWVGINNTWVSGDPAAGTSPYSSDAKLQNNDAVFYTIMWDAANIGVANFGQDSSFAGNKTAQGNQDDNGVGDFYYTPPSGFLALCTDNLPDPTIADGSEYFNTVLYTGTDVSHSITGVGFQPDWVWIKRRDSTSGHKLHDVIRGANQELNTDDTAAESTNTNFSSFDSDGFTVISGAGYNGSTNTYVAWNWKANGSGVSNTDGSVSSTVSANTTAGFSIVTYAGSQGSDFTIGHGLSSAPDFVIAKGRSATSNWGVYYTNNGVNTNWIILNSTNAQGSNNGSLTGGAYLISGASTLEIDSGAFANAVDDMVAYCFHNVEGYSKFGSYEGNGSSDGPFVYTGFRPAFVMVKRTDSTGVWVMHDNKRDTYNLVINRLVADQNLAEGTNDFADWTANGFKLRGNNSSRNASGGTYIYMAFAENPFKYSNAR